MYLYLTNFQKGNGGGGGGVENYHEKNGIRSLELYYTMIQFLQIVYTL